MDKVRKIDIQTDNFNRTNFIFHYPNWFPEDCHISECTLRLELPPGRSEQEDKTKLSPWTHANPSTIRVIINGKNRSLRIKQFLYDWAPPAAGLPCLWESKKITAIETDQEIGWLGIDYKQNQAGCLQRNQTQIELSVTKGKFSPKELHNIMDALQPIQGKPHNETLKANSFFKLNYWVKYQQEGLKVPHGLYRYISKHYFNHAKLINLEMLHNKGIKLPSKLAHYQFNSSICIDDLDTNILEYEIIYHSAINNSDQIWIHIEIRNEAFPLLFPLGYDDHPTEYFEQKKINGIQVSLASLHKSYGGHEALWTKPNYKIGMWTTSSQQLDYQCFQRIVHTIIKNLL